MGPAHAQGEDIKQWCEYQEPGITGPLSDMLSHLVNDFPIDEHLGCF